MTGKKKLIKQNTSYIFNKFVLVVLLVFVSGWSFFGMTLTTEVPARGVVHMEDTETSAQKVGWPVQYQRISKGYCLCADPYYTQKDTDYLQALYNLFLLTSPLILYALLWAVHRNKTGLQ